MKAIEFDRFILGVGFVILFFFQSCSFSYVIDEDSESETSKKATSELQDKLNALVDEFDGTVGVYYEHLESGEKFGINADMLFPTASMIKVPIMINVFDAMAQKEFGYEDKWTYRDSLFYEGGDDVLNSFKDGEEISVSKLVLLMITISDNTASLWLQGALGGDRINRWMEINGYASTRVNSRTEGRDAAFEEYGWGQTTPFEMASLLTAIRNGELIGEAASEEMYRVLTRIHWNDEALSQIPPRIQTMSKQGAVNASRSEVVLVNAPSGDYVFSVITKDQKDQSWDESNDGFVLLREVSSLLWQHFEPDYDWSPSQ